MRTLSRGFAGFSITDLASASLTFLDSLSTWTRFMMVRVPKTHKLPPAFRQFRQIRRLSEYSAIPLTDLHFESSDRLTYQLFDQIVHEARTSAAFFYAIPGLTRSRGKNSDDVAASATISPVQLYSTLFHAHSILQISMTSYRLLVSRIHLDVCRNEVNLAGSLGTFPGRSNH
jgi:hypothetical protein